MTVAHFHQEKLSENGADSRARLRSTELRLCCTLKIPEFLAFSNKSTNRQLSNILSSINTLKSLCMKMVKAFKL